MKKLYAAIVIAAILSGAAGFMTGHLYRARGRTDGKSAAGGQHAAITEWTCSMHPQIRQPDPGKCPLCAMDLIPVQQGGGDSEGERTLTMSTAAMKLAEIRTQPVERRFVDVEIPLVGKVDYDETRVRTISAWVAGRLDRLFVDYTGVPVKKGDHLIEIYSPALYSTQEELLQAVRTVAALKESDSDYIRKNSADNLAAVREKLSLLGLTREQIAQIEKQDTPNARIEISAPIGGIVIHKNAREGMYVATGTPIYTVADLTKLWVKLDAYESDLAWIKYGQNVEIRTESFGDRIFKGWISFVDPVLNERTRTVKVRVVVDNSEGLLRPNMFVRARIKATVGKEGAVPAADIEAKWICPMHPEEVRDEAGLCTVCGMDLAQAGTLGYAASREQEPPIVVPGSAVLITGRRAIVYVRSANAHKPTFEGREIQVGPRAGDFYTVRSGLEEGEEVVVNGNFKIDSALQLAAKPSMMSPPAGGARTTDGAHGKMGARTIDAPGSFRDELTRVVKAYYAIHRALAADDPAAAASAAKELLSIVSKTGVDALSASAAAAWLEQASMLDKQARTIAETQDIREQRRALPSLTVATETLVMTFGPLPGLMVRKAFCPMAFDNKGAFWLQKDETIANPYFGDAMLRCGEIKGVLSAGPTEGHQHEH